MTQHPRNGDLARLYRLRFRTNSFCQLELVGAADFDRDGKPDYLLYNVNTRQTWLNCLGPTLPPGWSDCQRLSKRCTLERVPGDTGLWRRFCSNRETRIRKGKTAMSALPLNELVKFDLRINHLIE